MLSDPVFTASGFGTSIAYKFTYNYSFFNLLFDIFSFNWDEIGTKMDMSGNDYWMEYSHLSSVSINPDTGKPFARGDKIKEGQVIGASGNSGNAQGLNTGELHGHIELLTSEPPAGLSRTLVNRKDPALIMQGLNNSPKDNRSTDSDKWE